MRIAVILVAVLARPSAALAGFELTNQGYGRRTGFLHSKSLPRQPTLVNLNSGFPASLTRTVPTSISQASVRSAMVQSDTPNTRQGVPIELQHVKVHLKALEKEDGSSESQIGHVQSPMRKIERPRAEQSAPLEIAANPESIHAVAKCRQRENLKFGLGFLGVLIGGAALRSLANALGWCNGVRRCASATRARVWNDAQPSPFSEQAVVAVSSPVSSKIAQIPSQALILSCPLPPSHRHSPDEKFGTKYFHGQLVAPGRQGVPTMKASRRDPSPEQVVFILEDDDPSSEQAVFILEDNQRPKLGKNVQRQAPEANQRPNFGKNVQGKAPPLRKLTLLRKAYPAACYPLLCDAVSESRRQRLSLEETFLEFEKRWKILGFKNPPQSRTSSTKLPQPVVLRQSSSSALIIPGSKMERLRDGMVVFRGMLPQDVQQWLCDLFFSVGDSNARHGYGCFTRSAKGRLSLNYGHRAQYVDELTEFPPLMIALQQAIREEVLAANICGDAPASVAIINYYGGRSNGMGWHIDADTDPPNVSPEEAQNSAVVSLSIGAACDFCYRDAVLEGRGRGGRGRSPNSRSRTEQRLRLESGDVLIFGGPSRGIEHCVDGLHGGKPKWLKMPPGRINITFRYW